MMAPTSIGLQPQPIIKQLNDKQMFALIVIEENRDRLAQNELVQAQQQLRNAERNLELAKAGFNEVQGAVIGANIMIERELAAAGFTVEEWQQIKSELAAEKAKEQEAQAEKETSPAESSTEAEPEIPSGPPAKVSQLKRRHR